MRTLAAIPLACSLLLVASSASAHFRLVAPESVTKQDGTGNPQKPDTPTDGCPAGTASGLATQVEAGGKVKVRITETVGHGGHYRVAFAKTEAEFKFPATVATNNQCVSTTIEATPKLPVIADGLFKHTQAQADADNFCNGTATCETEVTIPDVAPGDYLLQVIEWMLPHGSGANNGIEGCYYAHCATIQVVASGTPVSDGGVIGVDGGSSSGGTTSSSSGSSGSSGASGSSSGAGEQPDDGSSGSSSRRLAQSEPADDGCAMTSANGASLWAPLLVALAALRVARRRAKR